MHFSYVHDYLLSAGAISTSVEFLYYIKVGVGTYPLRVASLSKDAFTPRKVLVLSRKRWHRADMKDIVEWTIKHLNTKKQAFGAFKAVRHRMVENYLGIEQN